MIAAIETRDLTKRFGRAAAVRDLALNVPTGSVYGFLGPNGAGKTTAIRLLLGLLQPDHGAVIIMGDDLHLQRAKALSNVGAMVESTSLYDHLSGGDNLRITRSLLGMPETEIHRVLDIVDMQHAIGQRVGTYSLGMKQRLALARALMGSPRLLILDEPTNGLDPDGIMAMRLLIKDLPTRIGGTVFLSSHLLAEVEQIADVVGIIDQGGLVAQSHIEKLTQGMPLLVIGVAGPMGAMSMLKSTGLVVVQIASDTIQVEVPTNEEPRHFASSINSKLLDNGFSVHGLAIRSRRLEDVYQEAISMKLATAPEYGRPQ